MKSASGLIDRHFATLLIVCVAVMQQRESVILLGLIAE